MAEKRTNKSDREKHGEGEKDKVAGLRAKLAEASEVLRAREEEFPAAKNDKERETISERVSRAKAKVEELRAKVKRAEIEARYEEAQQRIKAAKQALEEVEEEGLATPETRDRFERIVVAQIDELINLRATMNRLGGRAEEIAEKIRFFVLHNPTGWVAGVDDPERKYLCYLSLDGRFQVILEDSPLYTLEVDALVQLLGVQEAVKFFKVDYTAVRDAAQDGILKTPKGALVDLDKIRELRQRTERTKKVKALVRGSQRVEEIVEVVAPELKDEFVEKLESLGLDRATVSALHGAGLTRVGELRWMSGDDLAKIKGIGPVRAGAIIRAIVSRVK